MTKFVELYETVFPAIFLFLYYVDFTLPFLICSLFHSMSSCLDYLSAHTTISPMNFSGLPGTTLSRLKLTSQKIKTLVEGIRSIAKQDEPIGEVSSDE